VILLDTHVWVWWMDGGTNLPPDYLTLIRAEVANGLGVCAIFYWEVANWSSWVGSGARLVMRAAEKNATIYCLLGVLGDVTSAPNVMTQ